MKFRESLSRRPLANIAENSQRDRAGLRQLSGSSQAIQSLTKRITRKAVIKSRGTKTVE